MGDALIPESLFCLVLLIPIMHTGLNFPPVAFMGHAVAFRNLDWIFYFLLFSQLILPNDRRAKRCSVKCCCNGRRPRKENMKKVQFLACELI